MAVLVIAEHNRAALSPAVYSLIAAARQIDAEADLLVLDETGAIAHEASKAQGVRRVLLCKAPFFAHEIAENTASAVLSQSKEYTHFLFAANPDGKSAAPRVAAKLDCAQISEVTQILNAGTFKHPVYAGSAFEIVKTLDEKVVLTVRTTAFDGTSPDGGSAETVEIEAPAPFAGATFVSRDEVKTDRPDLQSAKVVLAGGRGLGDEAEFSEMEKLADKLHAAVGTTRAVVDAGLAPNDWQIGQTGKIIAPDLYFAFGISGAIQHVAGIKDAKVIVAVNKDPEAPIFEVADYAVVGDALGAIRELSDKL